MNRMNDANDFTSLSKGSILSLLLVIFLSGCMTKTTSGVRLERGQLEQIKIGQTTQAEVETLLGKPSSVKKSNGLIELYYEEQEFEHRQMTPPVPVVGVIPAIVAETLAGKSRLKMDITRIIVGQDGKVADIKKMAMDSHRTGAFVNDDYPKTDTTKANQIKPGRTTEREVEALMGAPPMMIMSQGINANPIKLWPYEIGQFSSLGVIFRKDGIVDEVTEIFKDARYYPKGIDANDLAQIRERVSTRKAAESILGHPDMISHFENGAFHTYFIKMGETKEAVFIRYDSDGLVTTLMRKPILQQ